MSFKWKWLLTTFVAQLMLGGIFTGIQYTHMGNVAETELQRTRDSFQAELTQAHRPGSTYSMDVVSSMVRDFYTRYKPTAVWIDSEDGVLYTLGEVPKSTDQVPPPLLSTISLPTPSHQLIILFDHHDVYRSRNDMVFYLTGVFLLSAIACSMILFGLSNTLSARLEDLRSKAMELQSGKIHSRIEVKGRDEISCLGAAFNSMAQAIEQQMKVMEENHANSEQRCHRHAAARQVGVSQRDREQRDRPPDERTEPRLCVSFCHRSR